ncbi:MAG: IclR family transcriptional regulator [Pseudomonadota bacterium]
MNGSSQTEAKRKNDSGGIQVIARAVEILRVLRDDRSGLSLGKIAKLVNLPRSTVQRIVNALVSEELVSMGHGSRGYTLGPEVLSLAKAAEIDLAKTLHPFLENLSRRTGETVDLAVFKGDHMQFVDQVMGSHRLRAVSAVGDRFPMTVTANGKAVLSYFAAETAEQIFEKEKAAGTTNQTLKEFRAERKLIQSRRYALDIDEHTVGISAAGIALAHSGSIYAISIPAPSTRFEASKESYVASLLGSIKEISLALPEIRFNAGPKAAG